MTSVEYYDLDKLEDLIEFIHDCLNAVESCPQSTPLSVEEYLHYHTTHNGLSVSDLYLDLRIGTIGRTLFNYGYESELSTLSRKTFTTYTIACDIVNEGDEDEYEVPYVVNIKTNNRLSRERKKINMNEMIDILNTILDATKEGIKQERARIMLAVDEIKAKWDKNTHTDGALNELKELIEKE